VLHTSQGHPRIFVDESLGWFHWETGRHLFVGYLAMPNKICSAAAFATIFNIAGQFTQGLMHPRDTHECLWMSPWDGSTGGLADICLCGVWQCQTKCVLQQPLRPYLKFLENHKGSYASQRHPKIFVDECLGRFHRGTGRHLFVWCLEGRIKSLLQRPCNYTEYRWTISKGSHTSQSRPTIFVDESLGRFHRGTGRQLFVWCLETQTKSLLQKPCNQTEYRWTSCG
jgi:hypothetical protein